MFLFLQEEIIQEELIVPEAIEPTIEDTDITAVELEENLTITKEQLIEPIQVTDDEGNPIHFTMQDGSALEVCRFQIVKLPQL